MTAFTIHTVDTAPEDSKAMLEGAKKQMGMVPNLFGVLAESPSTLQAYQQLHQAFLDTSFNPEELTVVWQTINVERMWLLCTSTYRYCTFNESRPSVN